MQENQPAARSASPPIYTPNIDPSALSTLCTVSQIFRSKFERALYPDIDLTRSSYTQVRARSKRVGECTRFSREVRTLILPERLSWSYSTSSQEIYEFRKSVSVASRVMRYRQVQGGRIGREMLSLGKPTGG
jgi:hypothetical protein